MNHIVINRKSVITLLLLFHTPFSIQASVPGIKQVYENSPEELLDIALSHPDVVKWLETHELIDTDIDDTPYDLWEVTLTTKSNDSQLIDVLVIIKGATGEVINITYMSYSEGSQEYDQEAEIKMQGLEFFKNDPNYDFFVANNYDINLGIGHGNILGIYGHNGTNWANRLTFQADIAFNSTPTGEYSFSTIKLVSDVKFGPMLLDDDDIRVILENDTTVTDYVLHHPEYNLRVQSILYYDNPLNNHLPGYVYDILYTSEEKFYLEYVDNTFEPTYNEDFDPWELTNPIFPMWDRLSIEIDPISGHILYLEGSFLHNHKIVNSLDLLFQDPEIKSWIADIQRFDGRLSYENKGTYSLTIDSLVTSDKARFVFNVTSGLIMTKTINRSIPAVHTADEVYNSVNGHEDIVDFFELNEVVNYTILYDTEGTWRINFYNPMITQNAANVFYNDSAGKISDVTTSILDPQPILQTENIIELVASSNFYKHYFSYPNSELVFYYNTQGYWSVYIYSPLFPENYYRILIDDETSDVFGETNYDIGRINQTNLSEANNKFDQLQIVRDFRSNYSLAHETVYFDKNWIYYAESIESQLLLNYIRVTLDGDLDIAETLSEQKVIDGYPYQIYTSKNYLKVENTKITEIVESQNYHLLDKMFTYSLSELFGDDYVPWTPEPQTKDENNAEVLIYAGVIAGVVAAIVVILLIRNRSGKLSR